MLKRIGERGRIVRRHQQRIDAIARNHAAAGHVRGDDRRARKRRLRAGSWAALRGATAAPRYAPWPRRCGCPAHGRAPRRLRAVSRTAISLAGIEAGLAGSGSPASRRRSGTPRLVRMSCAAISVRTPLSSSRRPTKAAVTGPSGSGSGVELIGIDAGAGNKKDTLLADTQRANGGAVILILHQHKCRGALEQKAQQCRASPSPPRALSPCAR